MKKFLTLFQKVENYIAFAALIFLAVIPVIEVIARKLFKTGVPNSSDYLQHLVLWLTFIGGMITSRERKHLSLSAAVAAIREPARSWIYAANGFLSSSICIAFAWCALSLVVIAFDPAKRVGLFPIQLVAAVMPVGYAVMAVRFVTTAPTHHAGRVIVALGLLAGTFFSLPQIGNIITAFSPDAVSFTDVISQFSQGTMSFIAFPIIIILIVSAFFDTPVFVVLGGLAYLFFVRSGGQLESISNEAYTMLVSSSLPAIPLFAFTGMILSESKAGERLIDFFRSFLGWLPGGMAIVVVFVCAFFTTFTGASGVTILALGGLLSMILIKSGGYNENFSYGLVTASGSIGLLFPPSLPVILYGVVAQISIKQMYAGGLLPGIFMVVALSVMGVVAAVRGKVPRVPFHGRAALTGLRSSIWELMLPVIILVGFFSGLTTLVEIGAITVLYSLFITMVVHRDIRLGDLPGVMLKCLPVIGGILVILALAKGLSYYIVDAEIPQNLAIWIKANIHSRVLFLILLNIALIVTGCFLDIYSAILVVVPLIIPLGAVFDIHPVHLGIIFLANLELGYLTPPVGLNLYLSSYLFNKPLLSIYRYIVPFLLLLLVTVIIITYVPWMSTALIDMVGQ
ncbi:MAG TPA: TRAP transporter large permease subunit [Spirochaetota bacterium]|nr:TRAP transporter large permease subunit [Spirochaetota bacterium]HPN11581.1 TRAP transporter large permease subunit [Spirochaetota bacterium]